MSSAIALPDHLRNQALAYLCPPADSPWGWAEEGEVLVWEGGETIVFREELARILQAWPRERLPTFAPLVTVLAALKGWVLPLPSELAPGSLPNGGPEENARYRAARAHLRQRLMIIQDQLQRLNKCAGLVSKAVEKTVLCEMLLADCEMTMPRSPVVELLLYGLDLNELNAVTRYRQVPVRTLSQLEKPLARFSAQALENRLKTSLEVLPEPEQVEVELPFELRMTRLLAEMRSDAQFADFAKLCRDITSVLTLPEPNLDIDPNSRGGAADLANKGPLHRLLLTELAQDFDVLAARLAMNEALYLRLEPTSKPDNTSVVLLVDCGLRLWGRPRVFAAATALSFAAKMRANQSFSAYRSAGEQVLPVRLDTRGGILELLQSLDPSAHPARALSALLPELPARGPRKNAQREVVLITHEDSLASPEFMAALRKLEHEAVVLALINREGRLRVILREKRGSRPLCELRLDPIALDVDPLDRERSKLSGLEQELPLPDTEGLPACLRQTVLPFLLPVKGLLQALALPHGAGQLFVGMTKRGELWYWRHIGQGARRVTGYVLQGELVEMLEDDTESQVLIVWKSPDGQRVMLDRVRFEEGDQVQVLPPLRLTETQGSLETLFGAVTHNHLLHLLFANHVLVEDPRVLGSMKRVNRENRVYLSGLFFASAPMAGRAQVLETIGHRDNMTHWIQEPLIEAPMAAWNRPGTDAIWVVNAYHQLCRLSEGKLHIIKQLPVTGPIRKIEVSRQGQQLVYSHGTQPHGGSTMLLNLETLQFRALKSWPDILPVMKFDCLNRYVRNRFERVHLGSNGQLFLVSAQRKLSVLREHSLGLFPTSEELPSNCKSANFLRMSRPDAARGEYDLQVADLPGGNKVFLDSRGLLHFLPADRAMDELSLVLTDDMKHGGAAWFNSGLVKGNPFFTGVERTPNHTVITSYLQQFYRNIPA